MGYFGGILFVLGGLRGGLWGRYPGKIPRDAPPPSIARIRRMVMRFSLVFFLVFPPLGYGGRGKLRWRLCDFG